MGKFKSVGADPAGMTEPGVSIKQYVPSSFRQ